MIVDENYLTSRYIYDYDWLEVGYGVTGLLQDLIHSCCEFDVACGCEQWTCWPLIHWLNWSEINSQRSSTQ